MDDLVERLRAAAEVGCGDGSNKTSREIADGLNEAADRIEKLERAGRALFEASKFHDPDDWEGEPAMILMAEALGDLSAPPSPVVPDER